MSKLQRTGKRLTEQDAIELAEASGINGDVFEIRIRRKNGCSRVQIEYHGGNVGYIADVITDDGNEVNDIECCFDSDCSETKGLFINTLGFTNKALELGYYEIVE